MKTPVQTKPVLEPELGFLLQWERPPEVRRVLRAGAVSLLLHVIGIAGVILLPAGTVHQGPHILSALQRVTPLVLPPSELTQNVPNRGRISKELDLEGLLPRPQLVAPPASPSTTRPAASEPGMPAPAALPEPPTVEETAERLPQSLAAPLGASPLVAPPPEIQATEKPKLAFEKPGVPGGGPGSPSSGLAPPTRLAAPKPSVEEAGRALAHGGGLVVGDLGEGLGGLGEGLNLPPTPGRNASNLELLSDPLGVDFRPYLIQVLSAVRRNWFAVMPESARLGRRGKALIQFAIARDGHVPKLIIAWPSGTEALDRAAVAGISASNPFPPLPASFRGNQVRLQLTFLYNIPRQ